MCPLHGNQILKIHHKFINNESCALLGKLKLAWNCFYKKLDSIIKILTKEQKKCNRSP